MAETAGNSLFLCRLQAPTDPALSAGSGAKMEVFVLCLMGTNSSFLPPKSDSNSYALGIAKDWSGQNLRQSYLEQAGDKKSNGSMVLNLLAPSKDK
jgi:hypothetical protein